MAAKKFVVVYSLKNAVQSENGSDVITEEYDLDDIKKQIERRTNQKISIAHEEIERNDNQVILILSCVVRD
jgi:hypothetical protein